MRKYPFLSVLRFFAATLLLFLPLAIPRGGPILPACQRLLVEVPVPEQSGDDAILRTKEVRQTEDQPQN
jgi:hypothetical protein